ncbi:alkaline phosphatase family protein, partial [Kitasatospora sp. NPDC094015]|uniref:alkaline phosphatase family protein n=1 Tax=Kitasatospora sp. NPDC094015 TaxID=3155205 RepID=UPI0033174090
MSDLSRRTFVGATAAAGAAAVVGLPSTNASAATAATGSVADVKHVVILMQENRSFDHYFGTLNGVRG